MILLTQHIAGCFDRCHRLCQDSGVFGVEHPSESMYFVPGPGGGRPQLKMITGYGADAGGCVLTVDRHARRLVLNGGSGRLPQAPPDYAISAGGNVLLASDLYPRAHRSGNERYRIREAESEVGADDESVASAC